MHPKDRAAMGRGDRLGQRYGLRSIILYLLALGTIAGGLIVYGCSGDDNNNNPVQVSRATLSGANEVPPVNTQATGTVTLNISSDSSQINYQVVLVGPFTSPLLFAHIHVGQPGVNGPVVVFFCGGGLQNIPCPATINGGTVVGTVTAADFIPSAAATAQGVNNFADLVAAIEASNTYSNAHTVINPGGEIRGQNTP